MSLDRRSFKIGVIAGVFLITGVAVGVVLSSRFGWLPVAHSSPPVPSPDATAIAADSPQHDFVAVAKATMPAVVNISTTRVIRTPAGQMPAPFMEDPFFRQFFGQNFYHQFHVPRERRESALGSGVIVDPSGYIVTNNHVVAKATTIKVYLADKREFTGKVVGTDPKTDIAVIKINATGLPTIPWGDSDKLQVGQYVVAIGNPFGLNQTVTSGIVSAIGRANVGIADYEDFIQTDAAINPGNSGGALVNVRGRLVGINTAIFTRSGGYMGIGFAVPSNMAREVMTQLIKHGKVIRGWLGVAIQAVTPDLAKQFGLSEAKGALVSQVFPNSPAAAAGLRQGDVIVKYDDKEVESPTLLRNSVAETAVGAREDIEVLRDGKTKTLEVKIAEQPAHFAQAGSESTGEAGANTALAGVQVHFLTPAMVQQLGLPQGTGGVVIASVASGSAAEQAGLQRGDVISEINRQPVHSIADYRKITARLHKNQSVLLLIRRQGESLFVVISP